MRASRFRWPVGLAALLVLGGAIPVGGQSTAPRLTACELVRLRSVPRWELDYSYRLASDLTASGTYGIYGGLWPLKDWTYAVSRLQDFRVVLQAAGTGGCSRSSPCVAQHPASLTVRGHVDSHSLVGTTCPGVHQVGCPGADACFEAGGHPFCGEACEFRDERNVTTPAPSARSMARRPIGGSRGS